MAYHEFSEQQRFRQVWLWMLLGATMLLVIIIPFLVPDKPGRWDILIISVIPALTLWLLYSLRLETHYDNEGIHYRFFPVQFRRRHISWQDVSKAEVIKYSPLADFGGWGIKYGRKGKAYNVSGNKGLYITLKTGKHILFGTQKPEELEEAISGILKQKEDSIQ